MRVSSVSFFSLLLVLPAVLSTAAAANLTGKVTDQQGRPLAGLHVRLSRPPETRDLVTDDTGGYTFENLADGVYTVSLRELGFEQQATTVEVKSGRDVRQDFVVRWELLEQRVVVTATRAEAPASLLGNSVTVISEDEIRESHAWGLSDLLRTVPGFQVLQTGAPGGVTSLYVRGGESDYTKVLLDGIPLNQPGGYFDFSSLSTANTERIEVVRGPQSALYGSDAIAGVVQIFTKDPEESTGRPQFELSMEAGNYGQVSAASGLRGRQGGFRYSVFVDHRETDNVVPNNYFRATSVSALVGVDLPADSSLTVVGRSERSRNGAPGPTLFGPPDLEEYGLIRDTVFGASYRQRVSEAVSHRLTISQSQVYQFSADPLDSGMFYPSYKGTVAAYPSFDYPYSYLNSTRRRTLGYQADIQAGPHSLASGVDYERESGTIGDMRASRRDLGVFAQDSFPISTAIFLNAGLRVEQNQSFGTALTPRFSAAWLLRSGRPGAFWGMTRAKLNLAIGIKEPNLIESFSSNPYYRGNPDLKPERTRSAEVGVEQGLLEDKLRVESNAFYNYFLNQIDLITDYQTYEGSYLNIGRSQAWGLEEIVEYRPHQPFHLLAGYTLLRTRVLESATPYHPVLRQGSRLLRRPTHSGFVSAGWYAGRWSLSARANFVGARTDNDFYGLGLLQLDGYSRVDVSGAVKLHRQVELYGVVNNLLDSAYSEALGYPALKINGRAGLRFVF
jgi:vitamin B12 transporter